MEACDYMESKPLISVIIPVYNVDSYLSKCIESILIQTYSHLEILLIDDGSTDRSGEICDSYSFKDSRVKVFHISNSGVSAARNLGIRSANGGLISFIDSDDYVDDDFYEYLLHVMYYDGKCADVAYCSFRRINEKDQKISIPRDEDASHVEFYDKKEAVINCLRARKGFQMFTWNGLYRKDIVPFFGEGRKIGEDQDFSIKLLLNANIVSKGWGAKYNYLERSSGSKAIPFAERYDYQMKALEMIKEQLINAGGDDDLMSAYYERCLRMDFGLMDRYLRNRSSLEKKLFYTLRYQIQSDVEKTFKGIKKYILLPLLNVNEWIYLFVYKILWKLQK